MARYEQLSVGKLLLDTALFILAAVTVLAGQTIGKGARNKATMPGGTILGIVPNGNQDQFVDSVVIETQQRAVTGFTTPSGAVCVVTAVAHGFVTGDTVSFADIVGSVEANGETFTITKLTADTFSLVGTDGDDFTAYGSAGVVSSEDGYVEPKVTLAAAATANNVFNVSVSRAKASFLS